MDSLLPGFRYPEQPLLQLPQTERWRFHLQQLAWLVTSQPLLSPAAGARYRFVAGDAHPELACVVQLSEYSASIQKWLEELMLRREDELGALLAHFEVAADAVPLRLGRYAERLLSFFLQRFDGFQLLAQGLPLRQTSAECVANTHSTIGELDYLLHDQTGRGRHWELAVKLFLCESDSPHATPEQFIGPDRKDSLHRKLSKLYTRQLCHPLPEPYQHFARQAFSAGWMFYAQPETPSCVELNPAHNRGRWMEFAQLEHLGAFGTHCFLPLPRWRWLARARQLSNDQCFDLPQLADALSTHWSAEQQLGAEPRAVLIAALDARGYELERIFVRAPRTS